MRSLLLVIVSLRIARTFAGISEACLEDYRSDRFTLRPSSPLSPDQKPREFSHWVALGWKTPNGTYWGCGGSLIHPKFVLAAAHCTSLTHSNVSSAPDFVRLGAVDLSQELFQGNASLRRDFIQEIPVKAVSVHPEYQAFRRSNDLAVVELENEAVVNSYVTPACLWALEETPFTQLSVVGFPEFGPEEATLLSKIFVGHVGLEDCRKFYNAYGDDKFESNEQHNQLCAVDQAATGTGECKGNSGGLITFKTSEVLDDQLFHIPVVFGITSYGQQNCGKSFPSIFTRVAPYSEWIKNVTGVDLEFSGCLEKYLSYRPKQEVLEYSRSSVVEAVNQHNESCPGYVISKDLVLVATECFGAFVPKTVVVNGNLTIRVQEVHQQATVTAVKLSEELSFENLKLVPTCLVPSEKLHRENATTVAGKIRNSTYEINLQSDENTAECASHVNAPIHREITSCFGGSHFEPNTCVVDKYSGVTQRFAVPESDKKAPVLTGFVVASRNCAPTLAQRVSDDDIEWIDDLVEGRFL